MRNDMVNVILVYNDQILLLPEAIGDGIGAGGS